MLARLAGNDAAAGFARAAAALDRRGSRPPLLFVHSTLPHAVWRFLPDGRSYPIEGVENLGLSSKGWVGPQWQVDQGFQRHVLQVQYTDRLVGGLLDKLRARGLYDDAVIVLAADHGASFLKGTPRRPVSRENVGAIAPGPVLRQAAGPARGAGSTTARCGRSTCSRRSRRPRASSCPGRWTGSRPTSARSIRPRRSTSHTEASPC